MIITSFADKMATSKRSRWASLEEIEAQDICEWLKNESGKPFEESVLTAIEGKHKLTCLVLHAAT